MPKRILLKKFGRYDQAFSLEDFSITDPAENEIQIESEFSGVNFADVMAADGLYQDCPPLPCVVGYEAVGRITKIGSKVTGFVVGDRVLVFTRFGGYASHLNTRSDAVVKLSEKVDGAAATALAVQFATAYFCAEDRVTIQKGDKVLIHAAAGGVGLALVQLCKRRGATIFATAGSDSKLEYLKKEFSVDVGINYQTHDFASEIKKHIPGAGLGDGIDVAFDSLGGSTFKKSKNILAQGGRIVAYGASEMHGKNGKDFIRMIKAGAGFGFFSPISLLQKSRGVIGVNMLCIADHRPEHLRLTLEAVADLFVKGEIKPVLSKVFKASEVGDAIQYMADRKSVGKVALSWK